MSGLLFQNIMSLSLQSKTTYSIMICLLIMDTKCWCFMKRKNISVNFNFCSSAAKSESIGNLFFYFQRWTTVFLTIHDHKMGSVWTVFMRHNVTVFLDLQGMSVNVSIFEYIRGPNANFLVYLFLIWIS